MIRANIKQIWKNKRKSRMLLFQFFLSFLLLFILISLIGKFIYNKQIPPGFNYAQVWSGIIKPEKEMKDSLLTEHKKEIYHLIKNYSEVIEITETSHNQPFLSNVTYSNYLKYNNQVYSRIFPFGVDDNFDNVLKLKILEGRWFIENDNSSIYRPLLINRTLWELLGKDKQIVGSIVEFHREGHKFKIVGIVEDYKYSGDYSSREKQVFYRCSLHKNPNYRNKPYDTYHKNTSTWHDTRLLIKVKQNIGVNFEAKLTNDLINRYPGWKIKITSLEKQRNDYLKNFWLPIFLFIGVCVFLILNVAVGLFGVLWYNINHRKKEIGLRIAVGANTKHIYSHFISELLILSTLGMLPALIITAQFPILKVFNVEPAIYLTAMLSAFLIIHLLVTLCALIPSAQAAKIQPAVALHEE